MARAGIEVVCALGAQLGEGPVWDDRDGRLAWVDISAGLLHRTDVRDGSTSTVPVGGQLGCVGLRAGGGFVAAIDRAIWAIDEDGGRRLLARVDPHRDDTRANDGKPDPFGRFLVGTMERTETIVEAGSLWGLDPDGALRCLVTDVTCSNGLAWSTDGATLYYIDSGTGRIDAFDYDGATGTVSGRRTDVAIPDEAGIPDGLAIEVEGGLWVALWGGWSLRRYVGGHLDRVIRLPVAQPTSCTFGGPDLDELYVTSAWRGLSAEARAGQPLAGAVFRLRPGERGRPADRFAG